ncbi:MAG: DUF2281 domain-containing protein [Leptolyngbya sp. Prado105]|jgi:hypothetical protein|nr:DUF2281 domain-containing protein [Leptolyngbya sp. Prado105]
MTAQVVGLTERLLQQFEILMPERQQQLLDFAEFLVQQQMSADQVVENAPKKRVFGLHAGQVSMSEDFDEPLPDDFWFSETDPLMMTDEQIQELNQRSIPS